MGCSHAIYTVRHVVERFIKGGNTVNLTKLDDLSNTKCSNVLHQHSRRRAEPGSRTKKVLWK